MSAPAASKRQRIFVDRPSNKTLELLHEDAEGRVTELRTETTPSDELFDVIRQIDWSKRLIGKSDTLEEEDAPKQQEAGPFADAAQCIRQSLQEVRRLIEVVRMSAPSAKNLAVKQVTQTVLSENQEANERLVSVVGKRQDLLNVAELLETGAASLREQLQRGRRYRRELRELRKEFLVSRCDRGSVLVDCSHRSTGSQCIVPCGVSVAMEEGGQLTVAKHVGVTPCIEYLHQQRRRNFSRELFQRLTQEGLVCSGSAAPCFVLHSSEHQMKLECGHAGVLALELHEGEEASEVHVTREDSGERCDVMEVALQALCSK